MEEEDEDSMYAPPESTESGQGPRPVNGTAIGPVKRDGKNDEEDGEEEGEEVEEDESDSVGAASTTVISQILTLLLQDIDIITERKGSEAKLEPVYDRFSDGANA